jgi:hypothetical protein
MLERFKMTHVVLIPVIAVALSAFFTAAVLAQSDAENAAPEVQRSGPPQSNEQGNAVVVPKSMQDERRPASSGEDDLDLGEAKSKAGRTDTNDTDEQPLTPDTARPHPREGDAMDAQRKPPDKQMGEPRGLDNEGRRGGLPTSP